MASNFHQAGEAVNEGEIDVLRRLRDELSPDWYVVGNFEFPSEGGRWYECDAIALSRSGYGYLIETKSWNGQIKGNDKGWMLPSFDGASHTRREAPIHLLTTKAKKLASWLKSEVPTYDGYLILPVVVLVNELDPNLEGKSKSTTVRHPNLGPFVSVDPRTPQQASSGPSREVAPDLFNFLCAATRPPSEHSIGQYVLDELEELRDDGTEVWRCHPSSAPDTPCRLKRYRIDSLAPQNRRAEQLQLARQDSQVIRELSEQDVVLPWGPPYEDENDFVVVSLMPTGESLQDAIDSGSVDCDMALEYTAEMFRVLGRIHLKGVTHRSLRPSSIWLDEHSGKVRYSDFDFARVQATQGVTLLVGSSRVNPEFSAPEVIADFSRSSQRSDVYSLALMCKLLLQHCEEAGNIPVRVQSILARCLSEDPMQRPRDASEVARYLDGTDESITGFEPEDVLDDRFVVRARNDSGGLTTVYRLFDNVTKSEFGGKFVLPEFADQLDADHEWALLKAIPMHPNLARPTFVETMDRLRRGDRVITHRAIFLLTDWIVGQPLDDYIDLDLPETRVLQIGAGILSAIGLLHRHGVLHRDIKPGNVLLRQSDGSPVVLDFNVAAEEGPDRGTLLGTPCYRAPEVVKTGWSKAADLYSAGVCLIELVAGKRLGEKAPEWLDVHGDVLEPQHFAILKKLIDADPSQRGEADEISSALSTLASAPLRRPSKVEDPPTVAIGGVGNPYVEKLMTFFSQSSLSNASTRGLDAFSKWLYVDTRIDDDLKTRIIEGDPSLVVITGNAGDGKTAFIRNLEATLEKVTGSIVEQAPGGNGSTLHSADHEWVTNWDGSQDEDGVENSHVLASFLDPFRGELPQALPGRTSVIAINEGRLVDFLTENREQVPALERMVNSFFAGDGSDIPGWFILVNLNRRVLTAEGPDNLVKRLLEEMSDERLWRDCEGCPAFEACPSRSNASLLRNPVLGARAIDRIRETLDIVRLRRRLHITTRDLLSALAFIVVGNRSCAELISLADGAHQESLLLGQIYNRLFAGGADPTDEGAGRDRLLAELANLDVIDTPQPELDGRIWMMGVGAIPDEPLDLSRSDRAQIAELWDSEVEDERVKAHGYLRRKLYLEREDPMYLEMLPYGHLRSFLEALSDPQIDMTELIADAITASEGLRDAERNVVAVRMVDDLAARDRSFVIRMAAEFTTEVVIELATAQFIEYQPELIRFSSQIDPSLVLDVDIDVFEALMRMHGGFTASREELRGSWLSLATFKERLASMPSRELLLRSRDGVRTTISVSEDGLIRAEVGS